MFVGAKKRFFNLGKKRYRIVKTADDQGETDAKKPKLKLDAKPKAAASKTDDADDDEEGVDASTGSGADASRVVGSKAVVGSVTSAGV